MSTGTKAIMAAAGVGGGAGKVLFPYTTQSDNSGSDKYFLHAIDTEGNIAWTEEVGNTGAYANFEVSGAWNNSVLFEVGDVWWVMYSQNNRIFAIDKTTGDCTTYESGDLPTFTGGSYGPHFGGFSPVKWTDSGGSKTLNVMQGMILGATQKVYFQGYGLTNNRATAPSEIADDEVNGWGNQALYNNTGFLSSWDYSLSGGFDILGPSADKVYVSWQEGSSTSSFNVQFFNMEWSNLSTMGADSGSITSTWPAQSNYSRGAGVTISKNLIMEKYFDENWVSLNNTTTVGQIISGDSSGKLGVFSGSSVPYANPTITSPFNYGSIYTPAVQPQAFDYETYSTLLSDRKNGMWGFIFGYGDQPSAYGSKCYNFGYVETGNSYSGTQLTPSYAAGGDGTDYSNVCYKANHSIYKSSTPASINNMPSWQWRVINEDGYILMAMPDYSTSFQRLDIRILDGTNGQVGSTINVDFPVEHSNKKDNVHYGLREDTIWTELYSGSNTS